MQYYRNRSQRQSAYAPKRPENEGGVTIYPKATRTTTNIGATAIFV